MTAKPAKGQGNSLLHNARLMPLAWMAPRSEPGTPWPLSESASASLERPESGAVVVVVVVFSLSLSLSLSLYL